MAIPESFKLRIDAQLKSWTEVITSGDTAPFQKNKAKYGYNNESDFFYGQFIGLLKGMIMMEWRTLLGTKLTSDDIHEIEECILAGSKEAKEYIYKFDLR